MGILTYQSGGLYDGDLDLTDSPRWWKTALPWGLYGFHPAAPDPAPEEREAPEVLDRLVSHCLGRRQLKRAGRPRLHPAAPLTYGSDRR